MAAAPPQDPGSTAGAWPNQGETQKEGWCPLPGGEFLKAFFQVMEKDDGSQIITFYNVHLRSKNFFWLIYFSLTKLSSLHRSN